MKRIFALVLTLLLLPVLPALAETEEEAYYPEDMAEYVSDALECAVLYPSVFADYAVDAEDPAQPGLHAQLPDESAFLTITREENVEGLVNETWIALALMEDPEAESSIDEASGTARLLSHRDGMTECVCCLFSDGWKYTVTISWTPEHDEEFTRLMEYVANSFTVYGLGIG